MPLIIAIITIITIKIIRKHKYKKLSSEILSELGFSNWNIVSYFDASVTVKSRQALEKYDDIKFFKENPEKLSQAEKIIKKKNEVSKVLKSFLEDNAYKKCSQYKKIVTQIKELSKNAEAYRIHVKYISSAGNNLGQKEISVKQHGINKFKKDLGPKENTLKQYSIKKFRDDPSLLMSKAEYNKILKEQQKEALSKKHRAYYAKVNAIIDFANKCRGSLIIKGSQEKLDNLVSQLFDRTVNSIKKIKTIDSEEWDIIGDFIAHIKSDMIQLVRKNVRILEYYKSPDFSKIKDTCEVLMSTQREFNEYINEKVQSISHLFGTRVVRNATINNDEYEYIRPYQKTITPFTAEVSAAVFASAENNPMEYVVKNFYPNKKLYPEQIQKLQLLLEELETLKDAKQIIENYKTEYQQFLGDVPDYIMREDEAGFYSRLGFANIDESVLTVEYKFSYTSGGGMAQRSFTVPMTEETIVELINVLQSKLTASAFAKEQRMLMTKKLREFIKKRDNFTCCICCNSTHVEPNLLLEIDHIIPVSKGGLTAEDNLQTLCWKCNRSKSNKLL